MALNKLEIRNKYHDQDTFLINERNKHKCGCGCGKVIELKKSHYWNGIPDYIFGHAARLRKGKKEYDRNLYYSVEDIAELAGVSDQTVRLWNRNNKIIAAATIGRKNLYSREAIKSFLKNRPKRQQFDPSQYYTVQDLKKMGVSRSKLRILVRAGEIQEPKHHARKTHYLRSEIRASMDQIMEDAKSPAVRPRISKTAFNRLINRVQDLEERLKMIEDSLLSD